MNLTKNAKAATANDKPKKKKPSHKKVWLSFLAVTIIVILVGLFVPGFQKSKTASVKGMVAGGNDDSLMLILDPMQSVFEPQQIIDFDDIPDTDFDPEHINAYRMVELEVAKAKNGQIEKLISMKTIEDPELQNLIYMMVQQGY